MWDEKGTVNRELGVEMGGVGKLAQKWSSEEEKNSDNEQSE